MKKKIVWSVLIVLALIGAFGVYSYVKYQIKLYNTIVKHNTQFILINHFLNSAFPEELAEWKKTLEANKK